MCVCRNYHVFYYLLAGASDEERKAFHLLKPEEYHYLNQVCMKSSIISTIELFPVLPPPTLSLLAFCFWFGLSGACLSALKCWLHQPKAGHLCVCLMCDWLTGCVYMLVHVPGARILCAFFVKEHLFCAGKWCVKNHIPTARLIVQHQAAAATKNLLLLPMKTLLSLPHFSLHSDYNGPHPAPCYQPPVSMTTAKLWSQSGADCVSRWEDQKLRLSKLKTLLLKVFQQVGQNWNIKKEIYPLMMDVLVNWEDDLIF